MCIASKYVEVLKETLKNVTKDHRKLSDQLSKYDKEVSEIYHMIETEKFDAARGYCLSKQLQTKLRERRIIKHEMARLSSLKQTLNIEQLHNTIEKTKGNISKLKNKNKEYTVDWDIDSSFIDELILH